MIGQAIDKQMEGKKIILGNFLHFTKAHIAYAGKDK